MLGTFRQATRWADMTSCATQDIRRATADALERSSVMHTRDAPHVCTACGVHDEACIRARQARLGAATTWTLSAVKTAVQENGTSMLSLRPVTRSSVELSSQSVKLTLVL